MTRRLGTRLARTPGGRALAALILFAALASDASAAQDRAIPQLTQPVNDFAKVIDPESSREMDRLVRELQSATGDVVVVATVSTVEPYADIREYAVKMFENGGRGIGEKGKDNGVLVLLAVKERQVRIEVGYDLEQFVTDGFAGETSREAMVPYFRRGEYGKGLQAGVSRIAQRIASGRGVSLQGVPAAPAARTPAVLPALGCSPVFLFLLILLIWYVNSRPPRFRGRGRRRGGWAVGPWSGWNSGVGGFGGGSFGGGGFGSGGGGGFGGFGGGRSGGGGGGAGW
jgi:uncharacterized protein